MMKKFITYIILFSVITLSACNSSNETVHQYTVPLEMTMSEKVVYVDDFLNLTENEDLNIFENGVPDLLENALGKVSDIVVVPRYTVNKYLATSSTAETKVDVLKMARDHEVQYLLNGWIAKSPKGDYRFYANLMEVETEAIQEKIAIISFDDKEDALRKLNKFVVDITSKLSRSPQELAQLSEHRMHDYALFMMTMKAWASQQKGNPYLAARLYEKALKHIASRKDDIMSADERASFHYYSGHVHLSLAKLYANMGKDDRARELLDRVWEYKNDYSPPSQKVMEAMYAELDNDLEKAKELYDELRHKNPHENFVHIRLADIALKEGKTADTAIDILKEGMEESMGNTAVLARRIAKLELKSKGAKQVFHKYADKEWIMQDNYKAADRREVAITMLDSRIKKQVTENNPILKPLKVKMVDGTISFDSKEIESIVDLSCEETTNAVTTLAELAIVNGDPDIAEKIAITLKEHGNAANSDCAYHEIIANVMIARGDFDEAKKHALKIDHRSPSRFLILGDIYQQQGNYKKAATIMERAATSKKDVHPFVYYKISKAYELAGDYKKWNKYSNLFIKRSEEMKLIPEDMQKSVQEIVIHTERKPRKAKVSATATSRTRVKTEKRDKRY